MTPKTSETKTEVQWAGTPCPHLHVILDATGGWHFSQGEPWDNIRVRLFCLDCMNYIEEDDADPEPIDDLPL